MSKSIIVMLSAMLLLAPAPVRADPPETPDQILHKQLDACYAALLACQLTAFDDCIHCIAINVDPNSCNAYLLDDLATCQTNYEACVFAAYTTWFESGSN